MAGMVLDKVAKVYPGGLRTVDGIDLTVEDGEVVAELGDGDAMYVPAGSTYDIRNVGAERCKFGFGVAPSFLP